MLGEKSAVIVDVTDAQSIRIGQAIKKAHGTSINYPDRSLSGIPTLPYVLCVLGKIEFTYNVFERLGIPRPAVVPYYNAEDVTAWKRVVSHGRLSDVYDMLSIGVYTEFFIKPRMELKAFTGRVVSVNDGKIDRWLIDRLRTPGAANEKVWISDVRHFYHEWRCLIRDGEILAAPCYSESCRDMTPEELAWCKEIVTRTSHLLPAGCSMDVGLAEGGMSVVEYNDGWSLGGYGEDEALAQVVIARFEELARTAPVQ